MYVCVGVGGGGEGGGRGTLLNLGIVMRINFSNTALLAVKCTDCSSI